MVNPRFYAVIAGVGPGTGAAIAKKFSKAYPVVLLGRTLSNLQTVANDIDNAGGKAICVEADVSARESLEKALKTVNDELGGDSRCIAAIFNAATRPAWKSFLETTDEDFESTFQVNCYGSIRFSQIMLPKLLESATSNPSTSSSSSPDTHPPTLIFTGATAALKGSAKLAPFAMGKTAIRTLAQSLAREFGPKGIHVSHVVIDGMIDIPSSAEMLKDKGVDEKIAPSTIADTYWYLHTQPVSGFTHELEIRPAAEKW